MSLIEREITALIESKLEYLDGNLKTRIKFDNNFIGFKGHFPGNPVLPGVIMIKTMILMYELYEKKKFTLLKIKQAKFIEPVFADIVTTFCIKAKIEKQMIKLTGDVSKSGKIIAKTLLFLQKTSRVTSKVTAEQQR